jgi:hypothetical protein
VVVLVSERKILSFIKKPQKVTLKTQEQITAENKKKRNEKLKEFDQRKRKDE